MRKYASDRSIDDTHSPGIRQALMDWSFHLKVSTSRKGGEPAYVMDLHPR